MLKKKVKKHQEVQTYLPYPIVYSEGKKLLLLRLEPS
jgi:hypothetical protein